MKPLEKELLEVLTKECESVGVGIRQLDQASQRILPIAVAVLSLVVTYGIKEKINEIVMALPYLLITVVFYTVHTYTEVNALGGYRRHLEERINLILGANALNWESTLARRRHWSIAQFFLYLMYGGFLLFSSVAGTWIACRTYGRLAAIIEASTLLALGIGLVLALRTMFVSFHEAYGESKASGIKSGA